jgi:hypothetical protein
MLTTIPYVRRYTCPIGLAFAAMQMDHWPQQYTAADTLAGHSSKAARTNDNQNAAAAAEQQQQPSKPQIELPVPSGQLAVGRLLIKSMYEAEPDLSSVDQAQLVQLIVLADRRSSGWCQQQPTGSGTSQHGNWSERRSSSCTTCLQAAQAYQHAKS